jgi:hypothetical protein
MAIGPHVYDSWNITKKIERIMQRPSIKSPLVWYGSGFFLNIYIIMHSLLNKCKKNTIFEWNIIQKVLILNCLRFN